MMVKVKEAFVAVSANTIKSSPHHYPVELPPVSMFKGKRGNGSLIWKPGT